ncbi:MAG: hypothetical protein RL761_1199, partial [Pseudomonadota bacterium]
RWLRAAVKKINHRAIDQGDDGGGLGLLSIAF